ncbi:MAG: tetratricopeptide repeat protein, partial [Anaerolineae bacterium]|nr:tetratricopeptide repeat protein [Anaerolineae bacterium]
MTPPTEPEKQPASSDTTPLSTAQETWNRLTHMTPEQAQRNVRRNWQEILALPNEWLGDLRHIMSNLPARNYQLAQKFISEGRYKDAIFRLRVTLWLAPDFQPAWYLLGNCYFSEGKKKEAFDAFRKAYQLNPDHAETVFMIATIDPSLVPKEKLPTTAPRALVEDYFNRIAPDYDEQMREMGYKGHVEMVRGLREQTREGRTNYKILDIGCGTGLIGTMMADIARDITGVDFSLPML